MQTRNWHRFRHALLAIMLLSPAALAVDGLTVGVAAVGSPGGAAANLSVIMPVTGFSLSGTDFQVAARADVALAIPPSDAPALGLAAVVGTVDAGIERYLGAGVGVGFGPAGVMGSGYALAGLRFPLAERLSAVFELQVAFSELHAGPAAALGLQYTFGWP